MPLHQTVSNASLCNFQLHSHALYSVLHSDRFTNWRKRFWKAEQEERERKCTTKDTVGEDSGVRAELLRISPEQEEHTNDPAGRSSQHWREHWRELQAGSFNALRAAKEVVAQAKAAGLTLEQGESASGYKGVYKTAAAATFTARAAPTQRARPVRLQLGIWQGRVCAAAHTRHACPAPGCSYVSGLRQANLDRHLLGHTGEKPHLCPSPSCNFSCSLDWNLKSHIKGHHHGEQLPVLASTGGTDQRVTPILRKLELARRERQPSHPVVSLKLSVCSDSGLVCALAEATSRKATVRDANSKNEEKKVETKRTKWGKVPPSSHSNVSCIIHSAMRGR